MRLKEKMLLVFAHPDDETFGMGGTIALAAKAGAEVGIICATRGEKGKLNLKRSIPENKLGEVRIKELKKALKSLGAKPPIFFNYPDGSLNQVKEDEIIEKIIKIIRKFRPYSVITFGPDGISGHKDHIAVSRFASKAFQAVSREANGPKALYWRVRSASERKAFRRFSHPRPRTKGHYKEKTIKLPYGDKDLFKIDILPVVETKLKAALQHKTQNPGRFLKYFKKTPQKLWRYETFCKVTDKMLKSAS